MYSGTIPTFLSAGKKQFLLGAVFARQFALYYGYGW